jgi:hypothetical protein
MKREGWCTPYRLIPRLLQSPHGERCPPTPTAYRFPQPHLVPEDLVSGLMFVTASRSLDLTRR